MTEIAGAKEIKVICVEFWAWDEKLQKKEFVTQWWTLEGDLIGEKRRDA